MAGFGDNGFGGYAGYYRERLDKLRNQYLADRGESSNDKNVFGGLSFWVNGLTDPPKDQLKEILMTHGGMMDLVLTKHTSFTVVNNLPRAKLLRLKSHHHIVYPSFIVDSAREGKLLDWRRYRLWDGGGAKTTGRLTSHDHLIKGYLSKPDEFETDSFTLQPRKGRDQLDPTLVTFLKGGKLPDSWSVFNSPQKTIGEFYRQSRLHWLSTWRQELADMVRALPRQPVGYSSRQCLMHIDIDCFFVGVAIRGKPELVGHPVAICHGSGAGTGAAKKVVNLATEEHLYEKYRRVGGGQRVELGESFSEIASCSYSARAKGIRSDMYVGQALKLCPELVCLDYDLPACGEMSELLYSTVAKYSTLIEAVSCDELYLDATEALRRHRLSPTNLAERIRSDFSAATGLTVSVGIGPSRLTARMATNRAKPDGVFEVRDLEHAGVFMQTVPLLSVPNIGSSMFSRIKDLVQKEAIECKEKILCRHVLQLPIKQIRDSIGEHRGDKLFSHCQGICNEPLNFDKVRKSVSAEINYGIRFKNLIMAEDFVSSFASHVFAKFSKSRMEAKKMTIKLNYRDPSSGFEPAKYGGCGLCVNLSKTKDNLPKALSQAFLFRHSFEMFKSFNIPPYEWRGLGIHIDVFPSVKPRLKPGRIAKGKRQVTFKMDQSKKLLCIAPGAVNQICEYLPQYRYLQGAELIDKYEAYLKMMVVQCGSEVLDIAPVLFQLFREEKRLDLIEIGIRKIRLFLVASNRFDQVAFDAFLKKVNSSDLTIPMPFTA